MTLTRTEKLKEVGLIAVDFEEFLKWVKIQEPGELAVEYKDWEHLKDFRKHLLKDKLIDLIKSKQIGISWKLAIYALWLIYTRPAWKVLEISKGLLEAKNLLEKSRIVYLNLPKWMRVYTVEPDSATQFGFKEMSSVITAYPSTETAGVGETAGTVIHDESDFHEFYGLNLSHTRATVADGKESQLISVSTVDQPRSDSDFKKHWKAARDGRNGFVALFYPFDARPGRGEQFYQMVVKENELTPWVVKGLYPRTADEALEPLSAVSCFKDEPLKQMWQDGTAQGLEVREGFIHILQPFIPGTAYAAGIDVGEGVGLDYSALTIVGKRGLSAETVAVIYSNTIGTDSFAFECDRLCREYNNPLLVVDNIGIGRAVIDKLLELGYPKLYKMNEKKYGWALTRSNKRELLVKLVERINSGALTTRFLPQVQELMEHQWINGYPEPTGKTHGDTVISLMLAGSALDKVGSPGEVTMYVRGRRIY